MNQSAVNQPAIAAINFALSSECECSMEFLHCWTHGDFPEIRRDWPEAPEAVFIGADPLHPQTQVGEDADPVESAAVAAIEFSLSYDCECKKDFLRCWQRRNFEAIREEWPEAPEAVFPGAPAIAASSHPAP